MEIFHRLREIREFMGISQGKFAEALGLSQSTYANYEKGIRGIPDKVKIKISQLGINMNWFIMGGGEMFRPEEEPESDEDDDLPDEMVQDLSELDWLLEELIKSGMLKDSNVPPPLPGVKRVNYANRMNLKTRKQLLLKLVNAMIQEKVKRLEAEIEKLDPEVTYTKEESLDSEAHEPQPGYDADDEMLMPLMGRVAAGPSEVTYIRKEPLDSEAHEPEPGYDADDEMLTPLMGRVAAGPPLDTERWPDEWRPVRLRRGEAPNTHYLLEVVGTSMTDAGIPDGSLILVRRADVGAPGEVVVAYERDEGVALKRLQEREGRLMLVWQDGSGRVRELSEETRIQGVFVRVVE